MIHSGQTTLKPVLVDTHAHLELEPLFDRCEQVVANAASAGVVAIVTVGIDLEDVKRALNVTERFPHVYACVGFHPHNAKEAASSGLSQMELYAKHPKVVGYGEIGLDFFRNNSPRDIQIRIFEEQLSLAKSLGKPVVIHLRDAYREGLDILERSAPYPAGGVIHCFSGTQADADRTVALGFHLSIPGTVTYKKNDALRSIVQNSPKERILLETDCPFLSPEPLRGKDNEPANIVYTAKKVAEILGITYEALCELTTANAQRFFGFAIDASLSKH